MEPEKTLGDRMREQQAYFCVIPRKQLRFNENHDPKTGRFTNGGYLSGDALKQAQYELIQKFNPKDPNLNASATWVESVKDIQTWQEAMHDDMYGEGDVTPDFKWEDALKAEKAGQIMVYSSKPIKEGSFVTPSKMLAQSYGNKNPYSMTVKLDDVAWIDMSEGQYAKVNE